MTNPITIIIQSVEFDRRMAWVICTKMRGGAKINPDEWFRRRENLAHSVIDEIQGGDDEIDAQAQREAVKQTAYLISQNAELAEILFQVCEPYTDHMIQSRRGGNYDFLAATYGEKFAQTVSDAAELLDIICLNPDFEDMPGAPRWLAN